MRSLIFFFAMALGTANATPIGYKINFSVTQGPPGSLRFFNTGTAPSSGSFFYDPVASVFSNFLVTWRGYTFDLTDAANNAQSLGGGNTPGNAAADAFAMLSQPSMGFGFEDGWQVGPNVGPVPNVGAAPSGFRFGRADSPAPSSYVVFIAPGPALSSSDTYSRGDFSIEMVPEPSSTALLVLGTVLLVWKRRIQ